MQRAIELEASEPQWHNNLGWLLLQSGRGGEALAHFERALELDGSHQQATWNRWVALRATGQRAEAERLSTREIETRLADAEETLRGRPTDVEALFERTNALWRLGRLDMAVRAARDASGSCSDKRLYQQLAKLESAVGEQAKAVAAADAAVKLTPQDTGALVQLAESSALAGLERAARSAAAEALARNDADPRAWYAAAWAAYAAGDLDDVETGATRVLTRTPLDCCTHALRGLARHARGDLAGAQTDLAAAHVYEPMCLIADRLEAAFQSSV